VAISASATGALVSYETAPKASRNVLQNVGKALNNFFNEVGVALDSASRNVDDWWKAEGTDRWAASGITAPLLAEFRCKALNGNTSMNGYIHMSPNYLCFSSYFADTNQMIRVVLPFSSVTRLQQAKKISKKGEIPAKFQATTDPLSKPDTIQVFTNDNLVHTFWGFYWSYDQAWNILVHAWSTSRRLGTPPAQPLHPTSGAFPTATGMATSFADRPAAAATATTSSLTASTVTDPFAKPASYVTR